MVIFVFIYTYLKKSSRLCVCVCVCVRVSVCVCVRFFDRDGQVLCEIYMIYTYIFGQLGPWRVLQAWSKFSRGGSWGGEPPTPLKRVDRNRLCFGNIYVSKTYMYRKRALFRVTQKWFQKFSLEKRGRGAGVRRGRTPHFRFWLITLELLNVLT